MDFKARGETTANTYRIRVVRDVDGYMWDFNDSTFKNASWTTPAGTLAEVDATNNPGYFKLAITTTAWDDGWYTVNFYDTDGTWGNIAEVYMEDGAIPATAATATAVMAKVVDGTIDVTEALTTILAKLAGDMTKTTNTYTYDNQAGSTKLTEVLSAGGSARTIA